METAADHCHSPMTASKSTSDDGENVSDEQNSNRYQYAVAGTAYFAGDALAGQFDDAPVKVWLQRDVEPGRVCFSTIYDNGEAEIEVLADLAPEQARQFGQLLMECAEEERLR